MRQVFKACFVTDINGTFLFFCELVMCQFQPFLGEPALWGGCIEHFTEISFESSQASPSQVSKFFKRKVKHKVLFHVVDQIDFSWFFKISQYIVYTFVDCP